MSLATFQQHRVHSVETRRNSHKTVNSTLFGVPDTIWTLFRRRLFRVSGNFSATSRTQRRTRRNVQKRKYPGYFLDIFSCPWIESVSLQRYSKFVRGNRSKLCKIRKIDKTDICCREVSRVAKIYQKVIVLERIAICIEKVARDTKKVAVATF